VHPKYNHPNYLGREAEGDWVTCGREKLKKTAGAEGGRIQPQAK
jgi:hypothetical protein